MRCIAVNCDSCKRGYLLLEASMCFIVNYSNSQRVGVISNVTGTFFTVMHKSAEDTNHAGEKAP